MSPILLQFTFGVVFLLLSTQIFVRLASRLSHTLGVSPLIVATTLIAIGTSLPELAVSTIATIKSDFGLAIGNIIGSNVINIFFIFPIGILIGNLRVGSTKTQRNIVLLALATLLFIALTHFGIPAYLVGFILLTGSLIATIFEYYWARYGQTHEDKKLLKHSRVSPHLTPAAIIGLIATLVGIIIGGVWVVTSVESISASTGLSTTTLGLSLTAIATSLPELLTTIFSQEDHEEKITIGNLLGSNIYNLLLVGGLAIFLSPPNQSLALNPTWLILATIAFFVTLRLYSGRVIPRRIGFLFLLAFSLYLVSLRRS